MVEVEDVAVREAFDVFVQGDELLDVPVLCGAEDGVVDEDAVDGGVGVGGEDGVFEGVFGDGLEVEGEAAGGGLVVCLCCGGVHFAVVVFGGNCIAK